MNAAYRPQHLQTSGLNTSSERVILTTPALTTAPSPHRMKRTITQGQLLNFRFQGQVDRANHTGDSLLANLNWQGWQ
jgi:hypothetical protein